MAVPPAFRCVSATGLAIVRWMGQQRLKTDLNHVPCQSVNFKRPLRRRKMFRRTLLASVGAIALTGSAALAADLAPPPVYLPPPPIWTGLYVGINAGYTWSNNNTVETDTLNVFSIGGLNGNIGGDVAALATGDVHVQTNGFIG